MSLVLQDKPGESIRAGMGSQVYRTTVLIAPSSRTKGLRVLVSDSHLRGAAGLIGVSVESDSNKVTKSTSR